MNKKRIVSIIAAIAATASVQAPLAYVPSVDDVPYKSDLLEQEDIETVEDTGLGAAFDLLTYIGVADAEDESADISAVATKAQAVKYFAAIKGSSPGAALLPYTDVNERTENYEWICAAYSHGIIENADKFYPGAKLSPEDAALMAMNTLGYNRLYDKDSVMSFADEFKLFRGVDISKGEITLAGLMRIAENTLAVPYVDFSMIGVGEYTISEGDKTYLEEKKNIIIQSGIVTAVGFTSVYGDSELEKNEIEINRGVFECVEAPKSDMVGKSVRAYVDITDEGNTLIALWEYKNTSHEFAWEDVEYVENSLLETVEGKKYKLSEKTKVIYNGVYYGTHREAMTDKKYDKFHRISVTDNDSDGIFDVIGIFKADTFIVRNVSAVSERIDFKYGFESIEKNDNVTITVISEGEEIPVDKINPQSVVSVYMAENTNGHRVYTVYVSTETVTDILKEIINEDDGRFYTVDNKKYKLSDNFIWYLENDTSDEKPSMGGEYTFYISTEGEIAGVASKTSGFNFGWVMGAYPHDDNDELFSIQLYKTDGSVETFQMKEKVKFYNETEMKGRKLEASMVYDGLRASGEVIYDVVAYKLNANNQIVELALPLDYKDSAPGTIDYPLIRNYTNLIGYNTDGSLNVEEVRSYRNIMNSQYRVSGVTTITYPVDKADRKIEKMYKRSQYSGGVDKYHRTEQVTIYNSDKFFKPSLITIGAGVTFNIDEESTAYMVVRVADSINEDDLPVKAITYLNGDVEQTRNLSEDCVISQDSCSWYGAPDSPKKLRTGDIIQMVTNTRGEINCVRVLYKADNPSPIGYQDSKGGTMENVHPLNVIHGRVQDYDDKCVLVDIAREGQPTDIWPMPTGDTAFGKVTFTLFDTKKGEVSAIDRNEIKCGDEIVLRKDYTYGVNFFIIR